MGSVVLVVEDAPDILNLLRDLFEDEGYQVLTFRAPDLQRIKNADSPPDVALVDLMLPGMNGVDLARELQNIYPGTPIIAMSASRFMLERASASGLFAEVVAKPFNLTALTESVGRGMEAGSAHYIPPN